MGRTFTFTTGIGTTDCPVRNRHYIDWANPAPPTKMGNTKYKACCYEIQYHVRNPNRTYSSTYLLSSRLFYQIYRWSKNPRKKQQARIAIYNCYEDVQNSLNVNYSQQIRRRTILTYYLKMSEACKPQGAQPKSDRHFAALWFHQCMCSLHQYAKSPYESIKSYNGPTFCSLSNC